MPVETECPLGTLNAESDIISTFVVRNNDDAPAPDRGKG